MGKLKNEPFCFTGVYMAVKMRQDLLKIAEIKRVSLSEVIRDILAKYLDNKENGN